jgi:acyl-CoA synthetase (AMP-forming)/AMP-acid ligase II/acyl carrier protein
MTPHPTTPCLTLRDLIRHQADTNPAAPALLAPGCTPLDHAGLWSQVQQIGAALAQAGARSDTRVAVAMPNGPQMATVFLGVAAHAVCAPLNPGYVESEFRFYLEDTRAALLLLPRGDRGPARAAAQALGVRVIEIEADGADVAGRVSLAGVEPAAAALEPAADAVALILHTSGTTARPKIVPLSQRNLVASARNVAAHLALQPADRCLNVMPLFHIHGLVAALLASVAAGASVVCTPGFSDEAFFDWVREFQPSWYSAVPTIHQSVLAHGAQYRQKAPQHRFRFVRSSSAALPPQVFALLEALTGAPVVEAYGMTEAAHQMASNPLPPAARKAGSVGVPAGVEIALMDEAGAFVPAGSTGEIVIRGPGVTAGYENNAEANAKAFTAGWFRTGDQGRFDEDGYLYIAGRLKELVNRGGEKVSPREIDEALLEHPDVLQAVAFAVPHASLGEDLAAAVVMREGARFDESALRQHLFGRVAAFKVPSAVLQVSSIPKGPTGKVQRTSLHEKLGALLQRPFVAPRTEMEARVQAVFAEVLGGSPAGIDDNFFALGGDSLKGMRAVARLNAELALELPVATLFRHPSAALLAAEIDALLDADLAALSDTEVAQLLAGER